MATKLERPMKREIEIDGEPHTVVLDANGVKITKKGCRNGTERTWKELAPQK
jgi:hypothetical protein